MRVTAVYAGGLALGVFLAFAPAGAQEKTDEHQLQEMVVTAVPENSPVTPLTTRYGTQYNVVTEEQIIEQNSLDLQSTLRNVPGVMFQSKNLMGGQTSHSLYIRGRGASHPSSDFTVQLDGVPHYGALFGQVLPDGIAVATIGGIEVYKSPQPSQFGSGYASVNILPRYLTDEGQEVLLNFGGGSHATFTESVAGGLKRGPYDAYVTQSWASTDGHRDHSRAQQQNYYVNLGYRFNNEWNIRFLANYVNAQTLAPRPVVAPTATNGVSWPAAERFDTETTFTTLTLNHRYDLATGYLKAYWNETDFDLLQELTNGNRYGGGSGGLWSRQDLTMCGIRAKERLQLWPGGEILAGIDMDMTVLENTQRTYSGRAVPGINGGLAVRTWDFPNTTLLSPYLAVSQLVGQPDGFHVIPSGGFRYFSHNEFKDQWSYQAGLVAGYANTDLRFNFSRGVNYPSPVAVMNLVLTSTPVANPRRYWARLKPEVVDHYELALTHAWPRFASLAATAFYDKGKDRFQAYMFGPIPTLFNDPVGDYEIRGLELTGTVTPIKNLELFTAATWLDAKATGNNRVEVDRLPYTPAFQLQAGVTWTFLECFRLYADVQYLKDTYASTSARSGSLNFGPLSDSTKLGDITVVNARVSYHFGHRAWHLSNAELFVAANNLFDQDYEYAKGYPMPGRTIFGGFNMKFQ